MSDIKIPEMGESITEATILRWTKKQGEYVQADEILVELETDKIAMEIPAPSAGVLQEILKKDGETVKVHEIIGKIDGNGAAPPAAKEAAETAPSTGQKLTNTTVPPAARKILAEKNIQPESVTGTGKHGQITKADANKVAQATFQASAQDANEVANEVANATSRPSSPKSQPTVRKTADRETVVPMSPLRKAIATRLLAAQQNAAILTTFNEIDMHEVMALRTRYKDKFRETHDVGLGFMSFFTKAAVSALQTYPAINAEIRENSIVYKNYYDIGIAVGGPRGLIVPVVRNADQLDFAGIEKEILRLAGLVKTGKIALSDLEGGTFSVTNGGIYGSMMSTPILNPPQSGILGMHNIVKRAVVVNDEIVVRPMMYVALSYDHRIVDGKEAVQFLVRIKEILEDPSRLLLDI